MVDNPTALCYNYYISKETNKQLRKRYKMKNIVSILAVVAATATASGVAAEATLNDPTTVIWSGSVADLADGCVFTKNESGEMSYTENSAGGGVWEVTKRAKLNVSVRGKKTNLTIEADSDIERVGGLDADQTSASHKAYAVTVDYEAGDEATVIDRSVRYFDTAGDLVDDRQDMTSWVAYTPGMIDLGKWNVGKHNKIELGGTATMNYSGALIDNGEYELGHTATCLQ